MRRPRAEVQVDTLRRRAEKFLATRAPVRLSGRAADLQRLVHELEVHQVELELQNEELRQASAELETHYNELYDFAPVGYFTLGRDGDIEKANLTGAGMVGQARALLPGQRFAAFLTQESLPGFDEFLQRVMGGNDKQSCRVTLLKAGRTPVSAYIEAVRSGTESSFRAIVVDITSIEQARLALQEADQRLRLALAATDMGVWEWEKKSGDIYWSPECSKIFGLDTFCPTRAALTQLLHPEDAARVKSVLGDMLADGKDRGVDCRIIRHDGEVIQIHAQGQSQYDESGRIARLIGTAQRIAERNRAADSQPSASGAWAAKSGGKLA